MRPVFVGNFEYDTRQSDLERLFRKYGRVERVDTKSGKSVNSFFFFLQLYFLCRERMMIDRSLEIRDRFAVSFDIGFWIFGEFVPL